ncbi:N-acetylneuraminate synthase family protein [Seonamhaeicola marinus]|uniref:N-acetylneuraminate synthase n=1 Tax=Seonamhaeicola marinus TaxID=1912246 RepID=A0A5D0HJ56_9FLAO|nr:N-acetylneuraminate synthase family protein [Seonamhaeicola marinus]TYA71423.1 N-acetylneuraminate synthase [Seonamhaeicola marinus]
MKVKIIAEIAQAHDGSLGMAHSYIDALAKTGVNTIKFQTHIADAESSIYEPFRVKFSKQDKTRFDYWKRMEFTLSQWHELKQHCDDVGLEFMSSPFSNAAVDVLEEVGVSSYKIGSGEVNNLLLLEKIAQTGKPIILSSGMSSYKELDEAVNFLTSKGANFSILQCTTSYPTLPEEYGLNVISELKERYNVPVGFSDHSAQIGTGITAVAMGAEILEFHAVFNKEMFGPDVSSSLTMPEIALLVKSVRNFEQALNNPIDKSDNSEFKDLKAIFEKSLAINKNLDKGHIIEFSDLEAKKPANKGISASKFQDVIGKETTRVIKQWEFLNIEDIK